MPFRNHCIYCGSEIALSSNEQTKSSVVKKCPNCSKEQLVAPRPAGESDVLFTD